MRRALAVITIVIAVLLFVGCAGAESEQPPAAGAGMGAEGGMASAGGMVAGVVAASRDASIVVDPSQDLADRITVKRVLAPADGWVVVRSTLPTGGVLGATRVSRGESSNVEVRLDATDDAQVIVGLHVDRGQRGSLDFDPNRPARSNDKLVLVNRRPLEQTVALEGWGRDAPPHEVSLLVEDQPGVRGALKVRQVLSPGPAWVSVNLIENGLPGAQVGLAAVSGEVFELAVPLKKVALTDELVVTLFADDGAPGIFEFRYDRPRESVDQPYKTADTVVSERVRVR